MIKTQNYKRFPAIHCWIKNILDGKYSSKDNILFTVFGRVKRVRLVATIINKRELIKMQYANNDNNLEDYKASDLRFDLDDGTGLIGAVLWRVNPDNYKDVIKGDIIDIIGKVQENKGFISINIEIIKKVEEPNFILLRNAEIIKKIKFEQTEEIPMIAEEEFEIDEISSEIDINDLFEEEIDFKKKIYSIIKEHSLEGNGISFTKLKEFSQISEVELRNYIKDLELESKIYQSDKDIYQTF